MNLKTTLTLLILLVAIGGVWYVSTRTPDIASTIDTIDFNTNPDGLFGDALSDADVVKVSLNRPKKTELVFMRESGAERATDWKLAGADDVRIQPGQVRNLVQALLNAKIVKTLDAKASAADRLSFGIEDPLATVSLTSSKGDTHTVTIGRKPPLSEGNIVQVGGQESLVVVNRDLEPLVAKSLADFRTKTIFEFQPANVIALELQEGDRAFRFAKDGEDWRILAPVEAFADDAKFNQLLNSVKNMAVTDFVEDDASSLGNYGLTNPAQTIRVTLRNSQPAETTVESDGPAATERVVTLQVGAPSDPTDTKRFVRLENADWVGQVSTSALQRVSPKLAELRDRKVTRIAANQAQKLIIQTQNEVAAYSRVNGVWQRDGSDVALESAAIADVLEAFESLTATDYVVADADLSEYGLASPRAVVTVSDGSDRTVTVEVGDVTKSARNAYIRKDSDSEVIVINAALADRLTVQPIELRSREIFSLKADDITAFAIESSSRKYELTRNEAGWSFDEPADAPVDPAAINAFLGDLSHLRARRVVADGTIGEFGSASESSRIQFTVKAASADSEEPSPSDDESQNDEAKDASIGATKTLTLVEANGAHYATADDTSAVFELDPTVYRVLTGELINRQPFSIVADDVTSITIARPAEEIAFSKSEEKWTYDADPYVTLDQKKVADAIAGIARLQVVSYLAWQDADVDEAVDANRAVRVSLSAKDRDDVTMLMTQGSDNDGNHVAAWVEGKKTFLLGPVDAEFLLRDLNYYLEAPKTQ